MAEDGSQKIVQRLLVHFLSPHLETFCYHASSPPRTFTYSTSAGFTLTTLVSASLWKSRLQDRKGWLYTLVVTRSASSRGAVRPSRRIARSKNLRALVRNKPGFRRSTPRNSP